MGWGGSHRRSPPWPSRGPARRGRIRPGFRVRDAQGREAGKARSRGRAGSAPLAVRSWSPWSPADASGPRKGLCQPRPPAPAPAFPPAAPARPRDLAHLPPPPPPRRRSSRDPAHRRAPALWHLLAPRASALLPAARAALLVSAARPTYRGVDRPPAAKPPGFQNPLARLLNAGASWLTRSREISDFLAHSAGWSSGESRQRPGRGGERRVRRGRMEDWEERPGSRQVSVPSRSLT